MDNIQRTGSRLAIVIGAPIGILFSGLILFVSLFPPFDLIVYAGSMKIFWHPVVWAVIIPLGFAIFLWQGGKKIGHNLQTKNVLKISFRFITSVNLKLSLLMLSIYFSGLLIYGTSITFTSTLFSTLITPVLFILFFGFATLITSLSIGIMIVKITKNKLLLENHNYKNKY